MIELVPRNAGRLERHPFEARPLDVEGRARQAEVTALCNRAYCELMDLVPNTPERDIAIRSLEQVEMWAHKAIRQTANLGNLEEASPSHR